MQHRNTLTTAGFALAWTLASIVSWWAVLVAAGLVLNSGWLTSFVAVGVAGATMGALQSLVLRGFGVSPLKWIGATVLGFYAAASIVGAVAFFSFFALQLISFFLGLPNRDGAVVVLFTIMFGVVTSFIPWLLGLLHHMRRSGLWVFAHGVAFAFIGLMVTRGGDHTRSLAALTPAVVVGAGLVYSLCTGWVLAYWRWHQTRDAQGCAELGLGDRSAPRA